MESKSADTAPAPGTPILRQKVISSKVEPQKSDGQRSSFHFKGGRQICRKCHRDLSIEEVEESRHSINISPDGECCEVDENGNAIYVDVIIKCQCDNRLSFFRKYKGTYVLEGSCVMRRLIDSRNNVGDKEDTTDRSEAVTTNCIPEGIELESMELCITNPKVEGPERSVKLGSLVTSLVDEKGHMRHFIDSVATGSPAKKLKFKVEDELLLCNGEVLVDKTTDEVALIFSDIFVDAEFFLLSRRITNRRSAFDLDSPAKVEYDYLKIKAAITIVMREPFIVPENTSITNAEKGDILGVKVATGFEEGQKVLIKFGSTFLRYKDGQLDHSCHQATDGDSSFEFDMFSMDVFVFREGKVDLRGRVFGQRSTSDQKQASFLYVHNLDNQLILEMKEVPIETYNNIDQDLFMEGDKQLGDFSPKNVLFFSTDVAEQGEIYFLETCVKNNCFLCYESTPATFRSFERRDDLHFADNVSVEIIIK